MALMLRQRWRAYIERLRFRFMPRIVRGLVHAATAQARRSTSANNPLKILVDNTVRALAVTHETAWISTGNGTGYAARINVCPTESESRVYRNACYLPGIAHLARLGHLQLMTSAELDDETIRQPMGRFRGYGYFDHNLFAGISMESADGHVFATMGPSWMGLPTLREQQLNRLEASGDPLYDSLVKLLGPKHSQDAWHICTAEKQGLFCFLTTDFKLHNHVAHLKNKEPLRSLQTRVMTPEELGQHLNFPPIAPMFFSYDNASFPVRSDLSWSDGNRRRVSDYRKARENQR